MLVVCNTSMRNTSVCNTSVCNTSRDVGGMLDQMIIEFENFLKFMIKRMMCTVHRVEGRRKTNYTNYKKEI